jgi:hypothetical protein
MNNLNETQIRSIVQDEMTKNYRSGTPNVPPHYHNGNDGLQIQAKFLQYNNKWGGFLLINGDGTTGTGQLTIANGIYNPTSIFFTGIARTPLSGSATTKCQITARAELGNCYNVTSTGAAPIKEPSIYSNICTTFTNVAGFWVPTVNSDGINFITVFDGSFNTVASVTVKSFTNTSITLQFFSDGAWLLEGQLIIT